MSKFKYYVDIPKKNKTMPGRLFYCQEHVGKEFVDWELTYANASRDADIPYVYYFKEESDAVMFKLKFG